MQFVSLTLILSGRNFFLAKKAPDFGASPVGLASQAIDIQREELHKTSTNTVGQD